MLNSFPCILFLQGPQSNSYTCYCAPLLDRVEKKMDRNKREMFRHLDSTHGKLAHRISHLERKTKDQLNSLSNSMKENFAQVRTNYAPNVVPYFEREVTCRGN